MPARIGYLLPTRELPIGAAVLIVRVQRSIPVCRSLVDQRAESQFGITLNRETGPGRKIRYRRISIAALPRGEGPLIELTANAQFSASGTGLHAPDQTLPTPVI